MRKDFNYRIMSPSDLHTYAQLKTSTISQQQVMFDSNFSFIFNMLTCNFTLFFFFPILPFKMVHFHQPFEFLKQCLEQMFESVEQTTEDGKLCLKVYNNNNSICWLCGSPSRELNIEPNPTGAPPPLCCVLSLSLGPWKRECRADFAIHYFTELGL